MSIYRTLQTKRFGQPDGKIPLPDKSEFIELYEIQNKSRQDLADYYGVHKGTIDNWCKHFGVRKTKKQQIKLSLANTKSTNREGLYSEKLFKKKPELVTLQAIFYIIKIYNEEETFYKFGITQNDAKTRYKGRLKHYSYDIISEEKMCLYDAYTLEKKYKQSHKHLLYKPKFRFAGYTECYISQYPDTQAKV